MHAQDIPTHFEARFDRVFALWVTEKAAGGGRFFGSGKTYLIVAPTVAAHQNYSYHPVSPVPHCCSCQEWHLQEPSH